MKTPLPDICRCFAAAALGSPEQTRARMKSEISRWKEVIERANIPRK